MRKKRLLAALSGAAVVVAMGVSACSSGGGSSEVECFARAVDRSGAYVLTVQVLGASDCTEMANQVSDDMAPSGVQATPNTGSATGTEVCSGTDGNYTVNVYAPAVNTNICQDLQLPVVP